MIWPLPLISFFSGFCSKIGKNKEMILGKFESGARPGTWSNRQLKFRYKSIINSCKNKVKTVSKFSSFIHCVLGLFVLNTKIKGITKIWLINDFDHVTRKFFVFYKRILKLWPQWVEISSNVVNKWRRFRNCLNFIFELFNNAFASKFKLSIWLRSRSGPILKLSQNHFLIFTDFWAKFWKETNQGQGSNHFLKLIFPP
jgi:hypothetical protein